MISCEEILGREFDWIAVDSIGSYALFSSAGGGLIPVEVIPLIQYFDELTDRFETPHWGSDAVWDDYANLGMFVFDSDSFGGVYTRLREPSTPLSPQVRERLNKLPNRVVFDGSFSTTETIHTWR